MNNEVRLAALRAAAKLALSMTVISGCSTSEEPESTSTTDELKKTTPAPACDGGAAAEPKACGAVLHAAFPVPGDYRWELEKQSLQVVQCCDTELATHGSNSDYRWDCCVAYDPVTGQEASANAGWACTPWGPPVPPSMHSLAARRAARRALKAVA